MNETKKNTVDPALLELLCCPACKGESELESCKDGAALRCSKCQREFTVKKVSGPDGKGISIPELILLDS